MGCGCKKSKDRSQTTTVQEIKIDINETINDNKLDSNGTSQSGGSNQPTTTEQE